MLKEIIKGATAVFLAINIAEYSTKDFNEKPLDYKITPKSSIANKSINEPTLVSTDPLEGPITKIIPREDLKLDSPSIINNIPNDSTIYNPEVLKTLIPKFIEEYKKLDKSTETEDERITEKILGFNIIGSKTPKILYQLRNQFESMPKAFYEPLETVCILDKTIREKFHSVIDGRYFPDMPGTIQLYSDFNCKTLHHETRHCLDYMAKESVNNWKKSINEKYGLQRRDLGIINKELDLSVNWQNGYDYPKDGFFTAYGANNEYEHLAESFSIISSVSSSKPHICLRFANPNDPEFLKIFDFFYKEKTLSSKILNKAKEELGLFYKIAEEGNNIKPEPVFSNNFKNLGYMKGDIYVMEDCYKNILSRIYFHKNVQGEFLGLISHNFTTENRFSTYNDRCLLTILFPKYNVDFSYNKAYTGFKEIIAQKGDSISKYAHDYETKYNIIRALNPELIGDNIIEGKKYRVPIFGNASEYTKIKNTNKK